MKSSKLRFRPYACLQTHLRVEFLVKVTNNQSIMKGTVLLCHESLTLSRSQVSEIVSRHAIQQQSATATTANSSIVSLFGRISSSNLALNALVETASKPGPLLTLDRLPSAVGGDSAGPAVVFQCQFDNGPAAVRV